nr:roundabout 2 [Hymenolepis microstoma]
MAPRRKPVFTTDPHDAFGLLKRSLLIRCHAEGEPPPLIIWYKDGQQVQSIRERPGTSNKIIKSGELMFLSFEPDDEGIYYCNASNSEGWTKSKYAHAQLAYLEPITEGPQSQVTSTGENVIMHCKIPRGLPTPVVNWYHNTEPVQTSQRINIIDGDLHISEVQRKDAGTYQCEVRNHAGRRESEAATLTIHQKPRFEITPSNQLVKVGEDVEFVCRVNGDPKPSILWRRENGQHIPEDRSVLRDDKSLRIFQVRREDAGTYVCQAKNEAGSIDASAKLVVLSPPSFTITPTDTTVAEGERAVFNCQAGGSPRPFIRWVHNGEYFLYPDFRTPHLTGTPRVFVDHEGSLVVTSARKSDEGKYECRASHKTGMVRSSANLFVSDSNPPPIIVIELGPQNQTVLLGTTATLRCETHLLGSVGLPERLQQDSYGVSVTWSKNGFNFTPDSDPRVVLLSQGTLQINDINFNDQGNYTCRAETTPLISQLHQKSQPMYTTEWTANLHVTRAPLHPAYQPALVENLPRPPATVDIVDVGDSWISVKCTVSPLPVYGDVQSDQPLGEFGLPLPSAHVVERTRVQIEYVGIDGSSGGWIVAAEARPDEMVKISGLQPESGYRILARTVSPRGVGRPHILPHTVYTKKRHRYVNFTNYPTDHINSVLFSTPQLTSLSTSEIEISGRICGAPNALTLLTGIRVRYRAVPLTRCLLHTESTTLLTDHCLNYAPSLYAEDMDDNLASMTENYCSLAMLSDTSVDHSITQLPPSSELEHDRFMELSLVDSAPFRMVLDNLSPFVCYEVEVDAYSEDRTLGRVYSQASRSANVLTFDSTPSQAPQDVKARWIGGEGETDNKVLEVVWSPPPSWSTNGLITGFSLRLLGRDLEQRKTFRVGPKVNQYRVENLPPNTNFTLYLAAITCHGEGVRSEPYPIIASNYIRLMGRNASDFFVFTRQPPVTSTLSLDGVPTFNFKPSDTTQYPIEGVHYSPDGVKVYNHTWFIASLVGVAVLWLLIFVIILVCRRKRRQRVKQRYPPTSTALGVGGGDDMAFRLKRSVDRNSKIGLLDSGKENGVLLQQNHHTQQNQQQSILAPVGLMKHSSPRLQMGTGILTAQRSAQQQPPPPMHHEEAGYEAPGGPEGMKLASTGSIFLATGGTTSSSSQNSSLHKSPTVPGGVPETSGMETVNENHGPAIDSNLGGGDGDTLHEDDPNSVSPYASTSLIEQLRRGGERERGGANLSFSEVIPPPPHYPPPPVPSDSPPTQHNIYSPSECCHYAQSDLHQQKLMADEVNGGQLFMGAPQTAYLPASAAYPAPGQEQYWPPNGMCYVQQQSVVNPSMSGQNGTLYVPRMMGTLPNSSAPMFMTQQRSNQTPSGYYNPHHHQQMMLMMQHQQQPSSAIADDVVLPTSTLTHPPRNVQIHADN